MSFTLSCTHAKLLTLFYHYSLAKFQSRQSRLSHFAQRKVDHEQYKPGEIKLANNIRLYIYNKISINNKMANGRSL